MKFIITKHAEKRIRLRGIEPPSEAMNLKGASKKVLKKIKRSCPESYGQPGIVYYTLNRRTIYVCRQIGVAKYVLITSFILEK